MQPDNRCLSGHFFAVLALKLRCGCLQIIAIESTILVSIIYTRDMYFDIRGP